MTEYYTFQQGSAPAHRARETTALLASEIPDFISPSLWPPNGPDLNPVDYEQEMVYKQKIRDVDELRERIVESWDHLDQKQPRTTGTTSGGLKLQCTASVTISGYYQHGTDCRRS